MLEKALLALKASNLTEEISKQSVNAVTWFLLTVYSKRQDETDKLKKVLSKKEQELKDLEKIQPIHIVKNKQTKNHQKKTWKVCSGENTKNVARQSLHKEITSGFNQSFQLKSGSEIGL